MFLFINVATQNKTIILYDENTILAKEEWSISGRESEHVLPGIERVLESSGRSLDEVKGILVIHGPGAFTGLRVSVSVVNTILFVYPKVECRVLSVGEMFAQLDQQQHNQYVFQVYPSDAFLFDREGLFLKRILPAELETLSYTAGQVIAEGQVEPIPATESMNSQHLGTMWEGAQPVEMVVPFYAKEPNITTRKKL